MGRFTGKALTQETGVKETIAANPCQAVKIWGDCRLERSEVLEGTIGSIAKSIQ